nr:MmcQ/YjbR family DNA-binding protein [Formosa agariphila]
MNIEQLYDYCLKKKGVTETFPFDDNALVLKVLDKIFLLTSLKSWEAGEPTINLKCDPTKAESLRGTYNSIRPGFHMNKKHWNTMHLNQGDLPMPLVLELIDHSYDLVVQGLPKKLKDTL